MTETKQIRPRNPKVFIVDMNGETHYVRAVSKTAALNYAVQETVQVRAAKLSDMAEIATAVGKGAEIHNA
jgi:hypothetical protein